MTRKKTIAVVDAGFGNLASVGNAFSRIGWKTAIVSDAAGVENAEKLVLPGVGGFGSAIQVLKAKRLDSAIREFIFSGRPFLGICVGMQLLFEESEESPGEAGLCLFKGKVKKFSGVKTPQIGWNKLDLKKRSKLLEGVKDGAFVFFANSYYAEPLQTKFVAAVSEYCQRFCSAIETENTFATQFHPEKSGAIGLRILKNFAEVK